MVEAFLDDDRGYAEWVRGNPRGFILTTDRVPTERYAMVHRVRCLTIRSSPPRTAEFQRVCSNTVDELDAWAAMKTGVPPEKCGTCNPTD